jgi:hypothetical protein
MVTLLLKRSKYFTRLSIVFFTEKFLAVVPNSYGQETSERVPSLKKRNQDAMCVHLALHRTLRL